MELTWDGTDRDWWGRRLFHGKYWAQARSDGYSTLWHGDNLIRNRYDGATLKTAMAAAEAAIRTHAQEK